MPRGKKGRAGRSGALRFVLTVIVLAIFMAATLGFLYFYMENVLRENIREGFSPEDVRALTVESRPYEVEDPPSVIVTGPPPHYSCKVSWPVNGTDGRLDGYPGVGAVINLSLENHGPTTLYVESAQVAPGWEGSATFPVGRYVQPGEKRWLRHLHLTIPDPPPQEDERHYRISLSVLVNGASSWTRVDEVEFDRSELDVLPLGETFLELDIRKNWRAYYDGIVPKVQKDLEALRGALNGTGLVGSTCSVQDICDAHEWLLSRIDYRSDPEGRDEWLSPMECLSRGEGDCEDFAILYGAMISLMGGSARVVITQDHAFNAVYIGMDADALNLLWQRYDMTVPFQVLTDELGAWLLVEPQSFLIMGWFPLGIVPVHTQDNDIGQSVAGHDGLAWSYIDDEPVYVVDIYIR